MSGKTKPRSAHILDRKLEAHSASASSFYRWIEKKTMQMNMYANIFIKYKRETAFVGAILPFKFLIEQKSQDTSVESCTEQKIKFFFLKNQLKKIR